MSRSVIQSVAVIGAGISGVCSAAHLLKAGLSVTLIERCDISGGVWHYDELSAADPDYPNTQPSKGDYTRYQAGQDDYLTPPRTPDGEYVGSDYSKLKSHGESIRQSHAPPSPCYSSLKNNVGLTLMKTSLLEWPPNLDEIVSQRYLEKYIQQISQTTGVQEVTEYNTRVEDVVKVGQSWQVTTAGLATNPSGNSSIAIRKRQFDAVVVASGHYNMPRVPEIPGLKGWKERYPTRIRHSKTYRNANGFENQKVLLIGAGVSSCDIAKDLASKNTEIYQSARGGALDLPSLMLPDSAVRIGPLKGFTLDNDTDSKSIVSPQVPIPGRITLQNGTQLCGIHQVILATGYITSYPFLPQFHSDTNSREQAGDHLLVTSKGDMVHNLHKDIFYIEDPTLAFVGVPYHIATFSLFDFQAQIVARAFAGHLKIPSQSAMRYEYNARVRSKGLGRDFHSLRDIGDEPKYVQELVDWANKEPLTSDRMVGHTEAWHKAYQAAKEKIKLLRGDRRSADPGQYDDIKIPDTVTCSSMNARVCLAIQLPTAIDKIP